MERLSLPRELSKGTLLLLFLLLDNSVNELVDMKRDERRDKDDGGKKGKREGKDN